MARTFRVDDPLMVGTDIAKFQREVVKIFESLDIDGCPLVDDGVFGGASRSIVAALCRSLGIDPKVAMAKGVTPTLRRKLRDRDLTSEEKKRYKGTVGKRYRADLRRRWQPVKVHSPVDKILADSWGYHPPVHDGIDVICGPNAPLYAMVKSEVIDVRAGGWWGKAPSGDVRKGDGIIQLRVLESVGPFKAGQHIGYGHAEGAKVRVGQIIPAGHIIGRAGLAVAWHIHLMLNDGTLGNRGKGNRDPRAILNYAVKNG